MSSILEYSLQLAIKYKKYYKSLFLGLIDLVIVNAYITQNAARAAAGLQKLSHVKFMKQLHLELCQLREEDWDALLRDDGQATPTQSPAAGSGRRAVHLPLKNEKMRPGNDGKGQKRCVRACKSVLLDEGYFWNDRKRHVNVLQLLQAQGEGKDAAEQPTSAASIPVRQGASYAQWSRDVLLRTVAQGVAERHAAPSQHEQASRAHPGRGLRGRGPVVK
ncbi:hypothetical protein F441_08777 [Phytophthora nicotianae CJ01A1]|uniref:PiggyBac transposable element-derived protein domain-containing protein n=1 Tax=Phytophthora nicotianae CJ01A1 TaxID=1317063 RepID=W2X2P6_PHYNI|nr:hypothetical protein F441_08777 [Phytophthora nicotianae CJ01A1]